MELNEYFYVCRIFCLIQEQIEWRNLFYIPIFQAITISTCKYWMSLICFDCLMCRCTILSIVWKKYVHYFMQFSLVSFRVKWTFFAIFHTMAQRDLVSFYIFREIEYKIQNDVHLMCVLQFHEKKYAISWFFSTFLGTIAVNLNCLSIFLVNLTTIIK